MSASEANWEHYRAFLAVLTDGSLSAAARRLKLSQPTLGRQIAALEGALGVALFTRSPAGLLPTEAALALQPHAETMASAAAALVRAASPGLDGEGVVRLTASDIVGGAVLPPILAELREDHPRLKLELLLSNRNEDLLRRDADIAVRMARPTQGALFGRQIGVLPVGLFASPGYIQRRGMPQSLQDRDRHTIVGFDHVPSFAEASVSGLTLTRELFDVRSDSDLAQLAMIQAGVGIGACQVQLGRRLGLVPVLTEVLTFTLPMWVVMHEDLKSTPRMRIVFDALVAGLTAYLSEPA